MSPNSTSPKQLSEGSLESQPFARIFFELCLAKKTGALDLLTEAPPQGKILKRVFMHRGSSFYVQGGEVEETLGRVLVGLGKLSEAEHARLLEAAGQDYGRLEQSLFQGNRFPPHEIHAALAQQTELKIKRCFAWSKGHYLFSELEEGDILAKHVMHNLLPEKLLLEGVREFYPLTRIEKEFAGIEKKVFRRSPRLAEFAPKLGLPPPLLRFALKLPDEFSFGPIARSADAKREQSHPFLLALYLGGMITLPAEEEDFPLGRGRAPGPAKPKAAPVEEKKPEPAKREEGKLPIEKVLDRDLSDQEVLAELDQLNELIAKKGTTHFNILGVDERTPLDKVKQIYFKMAKVFHPDARPALYQGEIKIKVEEIFTHISTAYNTINDRGLRENYLRSLKSQVTTEQMNEANRAIEAETEFQKAEVLLRKGNWAQAEALLRRSTELMPEEPEYRLYHAWAEYKVKGRPQSAEAKRVIEEALKSRPKAVEGHFFLGQIYKAEGLNEEAEKCFHKVLELDPRHIEAQRELRLSTMRKEKGPDKKGGLFGRRS